MNKLLCYSILTTIFVLTSGCTANTPTESVFDYSTTENSPTVTLNVATQALKATHETQKQPKETVTVTTSQSTPSASTATLQQQCAPQKIQVTSSDQDVYKYWWSEEGETLYTIFRGQPGTQAFRIDNGTSRIVANLNFPDDAPLPEEIKNQIPASVERYDISMSHSGEKAIYGLEVRPNPTPGPTPTRNVEGLTSPPDYAFDIFIAKSEESEPKYLNTIDGLIESFSWSLNEANVLIRMSVKAPGQSYYWLANLSDNSLSPLFLTESHINTAVISPDGQWLLYSESRTDRLRMRSLVNETEQELALDSPTRVWWLSTGKQLLLLYRDKVTVNELRFFWYDFETEILVLASEYPIDFVASEPVLLSPDETKLAFVEENSRKVFVLTLCPTSDS